MNKDVGGYIKSENHLSIEVKILQALRLRDRYIIRNESSYF